MFELTQSLGLKYKDKGTVKERYTRWLAAAVSKDLDRKGTGGPGVKKRPVKMTDADLKLVEINELIRSKSGKPKGFTVSSLKRL